MPWDRDREGYQVLWEVLGLTRRVSSLWGLSDPIGKEYQV